MSKELNDTEYLRDLAERLMHIPIIHGTDQYDVDRLREIAAKANKVKQKAFAIKNKQKS